MKTNKLEALPPDSQDFIITLCEAHPYKEVVQILALPKPDGLAIHTSVSALCRFYAAHNPKADEARLAEQLGKSLRQRRQSTPCAALTGILAIIENHILLELHRGKAIADLEPLIKLMTRLHRNYLAEEKFNHNRTQSESEADFLKQLRQEADPTPGTAGTTPEPDETFHEIPSNAPVIPQFAPKNEPENSTFPDPEIAPFNLFEDPDPIPTLFRDEWNTI